MAKKPRIRGLSTLKVKALELRARGQLPYQLVKYIYDLNDKSDVKLVTLLKELSLHYLRVQGYYRRYPQVEESANIEIKKAVTALK